MFEFTILIAISLLVVGMYLILYYTSRYNSYTSKENNCNLIKVGVVTSAYIFAIALEEILNIYS